MLDANIILSIYRRRVRDGLFQAIGAIPANKVKRAIVQNPPNSDPNLVPTRLYRPVTNVVWRPTAVQVRCSGDQSTRNITMPHGWSSGEYGKRIMRPRACILVMWRSTNLLVIPSQNNMLNTNIWSNMNSFGEFLFPTMAVILFISGANTIKAWNASPYPTTTALFHQNQHDNHSHHTSGRAMQWKARTALPKNFENKKETRRWPTILEKSPSAVSRWYIQLKYELGGPATACRAFPSFADQSITWWWALQVFCWHQILYIGEITVKNCTLAS